MKNYYEILEVDKKASKEVIDKAYKVLVMKYHPDRQEELTRKESEEKMALINEAYSVLSNDEKRAKFDSELLANEANLQEENRILKEKLKKKNISSNIPKATVVNALTEDEYRRIMAEKIQDARQQAYNDAYIDDMKQRGYRVVHHETFKEKMKRYFYMTILIIVLIIVIRLILFIPAVRDSIKQYLDVLGLGNEI